MTEILEKYNCKCIAFDETGADIVKAGISKLGIEFFFFGVGYKAWTSPLQTFYRMMLAQEIAHRGDQDDVLSWCMSNIVVKIAESNQMLLSKKMAREKVDAATAYITALSMATTNYNAQSTESVYENRGVIFLDD